MELNWELCRIFYQVARCRNFSRAAAMLFTSQPAVSRSMAALERELGCRLFIRNRRGVELTPEGRMFYAHVEAGCEQFRRGREELEQAVGLQSGSIALGASETALRHWLLPRLDRFHALYPGVRLRLFGGTSRQAIDELKSGAIDFAVAAVPGGGFRALKETRLCPLRDVFVASSAFGQLRGRDVPLDEVDAAPLHLSQAGQPHLRIPGEHVQDAGRGLCPGHGAGHYGAGAGSGPARPGHRFFAGSGRQRGPGRRGGVRPAARGRSCRRAASACWNTTARP